MRIGIDVRKLDDYGIGTHIRNVVLRAAHVATEHQFCFYYPSGHSLDPDFQGPRYEWIEEPAGKYSIGEHVSLARRAEESGISLFHSPHYTLPYFIRVPSVVTVHDLIHFKFRDYFPAWKVEAAKFVMKQAVKKAKSVLTVSETTKNDLLNWMPDLQSKTKVLYNSLSAEWFESPQRLDLHSLGIAQEFVLYVGNFKKHKRIDLLVKAYRAAGQDLPQLVLVGQGHDTDHELSEQILSLPNVRLLGFTRPKLLRALYARALVFVFPSEYEGFGYPPLEAMASKCAVLSSDAAAMKEVLGDAAEFFRSGDSEELLTKLRLLLQDTGRREHLTKAGLVQAKKFASDESARKLVLEWNDVARETTSE